MILRQTCKKGQSSTFLSKIYSDKYKNIKKRMNHSVSDKNLKSIIKRILQIFKININRSFAQKSDQKKVEMSLGS